MYRVRQEGLPFVHLSPRFIQENLGLEDGTIRAKEL
jgi:hypothetical protein